VGIQAPTEAKFSLIIYEAVIKQDDNVLRFIFLCEIAGVSRFGYYAWIKEAPARRNRDNQDKADFALKLKKYCF